MKVSIVGLGLIGGSLALDLRKSGFAHQILGVELNPAHQEQAKNRGLVDEITDITKALQQADLLVLTVPVDIILKMLPGLLDQVGPQTTITDMGSTKAAICASVKNHPKREQYVATHPMAGTEHSGPLAAVRDLFANRTAVICDAECSTAVHLRKIDEMYDALKMRKTYMNASAHDLHAAYVSHLSHISSFVLANTVLDKERDVKAIFDLAGGGFESTVRLAKSSPEMWLPIFQQNSEHIIAALQAYIDHLQVFHQSLVEKRPVDTRNQMKQANEIRRVLQNIGNKNDKAGT